MDDIAGTEDDDVTLRPGSACQNAGNVSLSPQDVPDLDNDDDVTELLPLDLAGLPRAVNQIDMGAYEIQ